MSDLDPDQEGVRALRGVRNALILSLPFWVALGVGIGFAVTR